jgi:hypothetical protein
MIKSRDKRRLESAAILRLWGNPRAAWNLLRKVADSVERSMKSGEEYQQEGESR